MRSKKKNDFEVLVGRIQATSDALQQDALVVVNRSVTARAWLTGYYIVEYEQHGADRAKYGEGLLKKLAARLRIIAPFTRSTPKWVLKSRPICGRGLEKATRRVAFWRTLRLWRYRTKATTIRMSVSILCSITES